MQTIFAPFPFSLVRAAARSQLLHAPRQPCRSADVLVRPCEPISTRGQECLYSSDSVTVRAPRSKAVSSLRFATPLQKLGGLHRVFTLLLVTLFGCLASPAGATPARPNFIFVLIDDMGYGDMSCYGAKDVKTGHLDRLAAEGLRFTQFTVGSPICSPSRTALTTGQFPARWKITSYLAARRENTRRDMPQWLDPAAPSLARLLKQAGYTTGHFGKWHMGGQRDVGDAPLISEYGFDESVANFEGLGDRILPLCDAYDGQPPRKHALGSDQLGRGNITWMDRSQVTSGFVDRALQFIRKAEQSGKPFYVNLWPDDVHSPFFPPRNLRGDGSNRQLYYGVVKAMDEQYARLFDYVRESPRLRTNTVIIVTSDNGPEPGAGSAGPFRGHKSMIYEGGLREPFIVWSPGLMSPAARGTVNDRSVISAVDLLPSVARLAGVRLPAKVQFDGEDFSDTLLGHKAQTRTKPLFWNRPPDRPGANGDRWPDLAIRDGDWKLLLMEDGSEPQLYNLATDFGETRNLADERPELVRRLSRQLLDWRKTMPITIQLPPTESARAARSRNLFVNPIAEGADPWIIQHKAQYIACLAEANRGIALHISDRLTALGPKQVVWEAPPGTMYSAEVWAPELHFLDGRWYVHFAASNGENRNHRMYVLESAGDDPLGPYTLHGPLYTGDHPKTGADNRWAIDGTVLELAGRRYYLWSGWEGVRDEQWLYIAPMKDPLTIGGKRVRMCRNDDYLWERVGETATGRGLHEAPQVLQRNGRTFVIYSCSGSWQTSYKLGLLELRAGGDPLNPADWTKHPQPVFQSSEETFGVGHGCFVKSPDGREDWIVYHAKMDRADGWRRAIYAQPFQWTADGFPDFGKPVAAARPMPVPSGERVRLIGGQRRWQFQEAADLAAFQYFGHHQLLELTDGSLQLGRLPQQRVNLYRSGEKIVVAGGRWRDFTASVRVKVLTGGRDAGLQFRCALPAVGYDAHSGYFAGIIPRTGKVMLGSMDGETWREIASADADIREGREYELAVSATGPEIAVSVDGREVIRARDAQFTTGSVGLRVVDSHAAFRDLQIN